MFEFPLLKSPDQIRAGAFRISHDDYHGGPGVSSSTLKAIAFKTPAHSQISKKDTKALTIGRAIHMAILEPELFDAQYGVYDGIRSARTKAFQDWMNENHGKEALSRDEWEMISRIMRAVHKSKYWDRIKDYDAEIGFFAIHEPTGLMRKCKTDMIGDAIIDIKTTVDASAAKFGRDATGYGYPFSAAYYQDIVFDVTGRRLPFIICAAEKEEPNGVAWYEIPQEAIDYCRPQYEEALRVYKQCKDTGEWPSYPDTIQGLELPNWFWGGRR